MKKRTILPIVLSSTVILLASCGEESSSSNTNNSSEEPAATVDIDPANDYVFDGSVNGLKDAILKLKTDFNFVFHNDYDDSETLVTKDYYKNSETAYVNVASHKDANKKIAYGVEYLKNGNPYISSMGYTMDTYGNRYELTFDDFNFLHSVSDDLSITAFSSESSVYSTDDNGIVSAFNECYGTSIIGKVSFWFEQDNKVLGFELFDTSNTSLTTGSFSHVDNAIDKKLLNLAETFSWETDGKALTPEQGSNLFLENISCSTDIKKMNKVGGAERIASIDFKCNKDTIYIHQVNDPDGKATDYYTFLTSNGTDGRAVSHGLNAQNEKTKEESSKFFFDQWGLPKDLDINDFRLCGDGNYRYFALSPNRAYQTFVHTNVNDSNCSFEEIVVKMENDKAIGLAMNSPANLLYYYQATMLLKDYDGISLPEPYTEDGTREVTNAMSYFDGKNPFKVVKTNRKPGVEPTRRVTYLFDGTTYLITEESYDSQKQAWESETHGYTSKDDKVIAFRQIKNTNRLVQSEDIVENDVITNYFPKMIDPKTMKKDGNSYTFRELVTDATSSCWISGNAIPSTVNMTIERGYLKSINYEVNYSVDDMEYLTFSYENIALPSDIDINKIGPMELTCYADDSPDEWEDLVNYIGEDYAKLIPYYYDKKHVGEWYAEPRYSSGTGVPDADENGNVDYDNSPLIGVGLYCAGSEVKTSVLDQGFKDAGFEQLTSSEKIDVGYRDDDYKANGQTSEVYLIDPSKQTVWVKDMGNGKTLRVIYDSDIAFFHFNPTHTPNYVLGSGLLIQPLDENGNVIINREGEFH